MTGGGGGGVDESTIRIRIHGGAQPQQIDGMTRRAHDRVDARDTRVDAG